MSMLDKFFGGESEVENGWKTLDSEEQLEGLVERSFEKTIIIFKHSTTCGISANVKDKLIQGWKPESEAVEFYYLDLLAFRPVSNKVASLLGVPHQSPQVIVIKDGKPTFHRSHFSITPQALQEAVSG